MDAGGEGRPGLTISSRIGGDQCALRAAAAIDILAAAPLLSATSLAAGLGMAVKNAAALLDRFAADDIVVEVTHREKRRLFGLAALAPLREAVAPPRRPESGRGRGRPPITVDEPPPAPLPPARPLSRVERQAFDYSELESWMAHADQAIRQARRALNTLSTAGADEPDFGGRGRGLVAVAARGWTVDLSG